ncbi:MAG: hypothetical protein JW849_03680 [Phycisphaerae bacterium]|nr:hypothetical protein [Phycisphaerae bacterium]
MAEYRIVILARDGELTPPDGQTLGLNAAFVRAADGYEAAAELLAAPALALLIDLPRLTPPHRKLLHVARELGVEILGVGAFPPGFSADDLSGMRLISMRDLPAVLGSIAQQSSPPAAAPISPAAPAAPVPKEGVHLAPARKAEYRGEPSSNRQSRIIAPAPRRDEHHPSGRDNR